MCHRLGESSVTSVEYDSVIAARAKTAISQAGYTPTLVRGDGLNGYKANAPYDRIIATCSVRIIPYPWLEQGRTEGTITAPMMGWTVHQSRTVRPMERAVPATIFSA
ncbi:hypothetical protein [Nonomuraea sp. NPDC048916]|uniref:hypothetical protein n=1 Tax=Nonomuraea sp. NPDC048916 TaxID=3154232 RepID=UPI0033F37160